MTRRLSQDNSKKAEEEAAARGAEFNPDVVGRQYPADSQSQDAPIQKQAGERISGLVISGGGEGNRTPDTGIFSPLLYQLSYPANYVARKSSLFTITRVARPVKQLFRTNFEAGLRRNQRGQSASSMGGRQNQLDKPHGVTHGTHRPSLTQGAREPTA